MYGFACLYVCVLCTFLALSEARRERQSLLLQTVMSPHVGAENYTQVLCKGGKNSHLQSHFSSTPIYFLHVNCKNFVYMRMYICGSTYVCDSECMCACSFGVLGLHSPGAIHMVYFWDFPGTTSSALE